jgi:hypothetical protein
MDQDTLEKLAAAGTPEEVEACLKEKGVKLVSDGDAKPKAESEEGDEPKAEGEGKAPPFGKGPPKKKSFSEERDDALKAADKETGFGLFG